MISQKATAICIYEILKKYSDENHIMSADKIREKLKIIYDVDMERRAIYRNIDALRSFGIEIEGYQENREGYYLIDRDFEISEIRLLCDAVASSDIIPEDAGKSMIRKLIETQSIFQGRMLQHTEFIKSGRRISNRQLFYNIDSLNIAINQGRKVEAKLMKYGYSSELIERSDSPIVFSPYVTLWADGNYYILAKKEGADNLEHFRIDFIKDITILDQNADMIFGGLHPSQYADFYIFNHGEHTEKFEIECNSALWQTIAEDFGKSASVVRAGFPHDITVQIATTHGIFKSWVLSHINECDVIRPKKFRDEIQLEVMQAYKKYWG